MAKIKQAPGASVPVSRKGNAFLIQMKVPDQKMEEQETSVFVKPKKTAKPKSQPSDMEVDPIGFKIEKSWRAFWEDDDDEIVQGFPWQA